MGREYSSEQEKNEFFLRETDWKVEKNHLIYSYKWEEKMFRSFKKQYKMSLFTFHESIYH